MGRYIGPKNKIARRFGINLGLKTNPTKVAKRLAQPPGVHGPKKRRVNQSTFAKQLLEKQKAKIVYGLRERQLTRYVAEATRLPGNSETHLLELFEMRLDNAIYRLGFATTRAQARQMVTHGMFMVNGVKLDIPSHIVKIGDTITVKPNKQKKKLFDGLDTRAPKELPSWLSMDIATKTGKVTSKPTVTDVDKVFDAKLIIEYFSAR